MEYLIVGTIHQERDNPYACSDSLVAIASRFDPDTIMIECAVDEFDLYKDRLFDAASDSLEPCFLAKYTKDHTVRICPIDMEGKSQRFFNKEYWEKELELFLGIESLGDKEESIREFYLIDRHQEELRTKASFSLLNSEFYDDMWKKSDRLYDTDILRAIRRKAPHLLEFMKHTIYLRIRRDEEIFKNMKRFSMDGKRIMVLLGAGHGQPLRYTIRKSGYSKRHTFRDVHEYEG